MATVSFLESLAGGGPALELAIGTGRVALPLAARSVRVDGIDFKVWLDVGRHDSVMKRLEESHVVLSREGVRVYPIITRYAIPSRV